jgi:hypothetical protein
MSDLTVILRQSRLGLLVFATTVVGSALALWGMHSFEQNIHLELVAVQSQETGEVAKLKEKIAELELLKTNYSKFESLRRSGLVGEADREGWAETLLKVHRTSGLPDSLGYALLTPLALPNANPSTAVAPAQTHDMKLTLEGIHEVELFELLKTYEQQVNGRFRLESCQLTSPGSLGLTANCLLRFFNQPLTPPSTAPPS